MDYKIFLILTTTFSQVISENLQLIKQVRSGELEVYNGYRTIRLMHFEVDEDIEFASFRFRASQMGSLLKKCTDKAVLVYMKHASIPILNPDDSKYPDNFVANFTQLYYSNFTANNRFNYINITNPVAGIYYAVTFHPYKNPKNEAITQQGLFQSCIIYVEANLFVKKSTAIPIAGHLRYNFTLRTNETKTFKVQLPPSIEQASFNFNDIKFCNNCSNITARIHPLHNYNSFNDVEYKFTYYNVIPSSDNNYRNLWLLDDRQFKTEISVGYNDANNNSNNSALIDMSFSIHPKFGDLSHFTEKYCLFSKDHLDILDIPYEQIDLVQSKSADVFEFTYDLPPFANGTSPVHLVNIDSDKFVSLKFRLQDVVDTGGTLHITYAFKPKFTRSGRYIHREKEAENHVIVACLDRGHRSLPHLDKTCSFIYNLSTTDLILNNTVDNVSKLVPYPEGGDWYLSLRLFCNVCEPCACPEKCVESYDKCVANCHSAGTCADCKTDCKRKIYENDPCKKKCDCEGGCKSIKTEKCNTSLVFDISSYKCVFNQCSPNGKCLLLYSEGVMYSVCSCRHDFKGWDCSDDSNTNSVGKIILETLLLVLSNIFFVPAAIFAFRRKYYVPMCAYGFTFVFSSFYHACDSGEDKITFCLIRLNVLQFGDFFCALNSIWVTLTAMSYLPQNITHAFNIVGATLIGIGTTWDKQSLWVFIVPFGLGVLVCVGSWAQRWYKTKALFPRRRYLTVNLPIGAFFAGVGIIIFALFQTKENYKYTHSAWHALMAATVITVLPNANTFLPDINEEYL